MRKPLVPTDNLAQGGVQRRLNRQLTAFLTSAPIFASSAIAESERSVSRFELLCTLEEADHIAVLCIGGHSVPVFAWTRSAMARSDCGSGISLFNRHRPMPTLRTQDSAALIPSLKRKAP